MLRRRWKDFAFLGALLVAVCACLVLPASGDPVLRGFMVGLGVGLTAAAVVVLSLLLDGSLLRRIGRSVEADIGDDLRRIPGPYGVISTVMFDGCDVDHVVLAPSGIWVLEVKWSMTPADDLGHVWGLPSHLTQTRLAARKVAGLVRASAKGVPVHPVLVLAGPGMPALTAATVREGVRVVNSTTRRGWRDLFASAEAVWSLDDARGAAEALVRLRDARIRYEDQRAAAARSMPASPR